MCLKLLQLLHFENNLDSRRHGARREGAPGARGRKPAAGARRTTLDAGFGGTRRVVANFGKFAAYFRSFSAVSAPNFTTKYAFCSIFQNLQDYQAEIFEI